MANGCKNFIIVIKRFTHFERKKKTKKKNLLCLKKETISLLHSPLQVYTFCHFFLLVWIVKAVHASSYKNEECIFFTIFFLERRDFNKIHFSAWLYYSFDYDVVMPLATFSNAKKMGKSDSKNNKNKELLNIVFVYYISWI